MPYLIIVHEHSVTATYHRTGGPDPRCNARGQPGFEVIPAEDLRTVSREAYRAGLKIVPCPVCRPPDLPA